MPAKKKAAKKSEAQAQTGNIEHAEAEAAGESVAPEADVKIVAGVVKPEEVRNLEPFGKGGPNDRPAKAKYPA
jgi:hypothetical protein